MVMEAFPSPQSVGREFVRQYYTLLNQAPIHLHRFYNNQSSFVHGGLDPPNRETSPMIGQKQIHQKIQQLNFRDCHAKITQVDAQATLGNGVVVQVTGELSNGGEPMRRFTQTFVLACQTPKKYYVHNDIFRYQDVIVSDDELEGECRSDLDDEINPEHQVIEDMAPIAQQPMNFYDPNTAPIQSNLSGVSHHHGPARAIPIVLPQQAVVNMNGSIQSDDIVANDDLSQHISAVPTQPLTSSIGNLQANVTATVAPNNLKPVDEPKPSEEVPIDDSADSAFTSNQESSESQEIIQESISPAEPKTYATLLKSGGNSSFSTSASSNTYSVPKASSPVLNQPRFESRDSSLNNAQSSNNSGPLGQRPGMGINRGPRNNTQPRGPRPELRNGNTRNSFNEDNDDRRKPQGQGNGNYNDSNQLFLGNLPHTATEDELREIFSEFGPITDLRIHSKSAIKGGPPNPNFRAPPNYGFITFENQQAVQNCLAAKPIHYPHNDSNGVVLNVEEKKVKEQRPPYNPSRQDNGGMRNRDNLNRRPGPPRNNTGNNGGGPVSGGGGTGGNRPNNNFNNRGPLNRNSNGNTFNSRR